MAADAGKSDRDQIAAARRALISAHRAEQTLLTARHATERRHAVDASRALAAAHRSSLMAAISSKYAERLARVFDSGDARSAWSARERLKLEETIEIAQANLALSRAIPAQRRTQLAAIRIAQSGERRGLSIRQRHQRAVLAVLLRRFSRPAGQPDTPQHTRITTAPARLHRRTLT